MNVQPIIPCNLCGSSSQQVIFEAGQAQCARIVRCRECGLMFASPRAQLVDHEDYERYAPEGLLDGVENDERHPYRWRFEKEKFQVKDFDATYALLKDLHPQGGHVVEVGSGLAFQLRRFKDDGWKVTGVDPWAEVCSFTERYHGIATIPATLEAAALPDASADVVFLLHVIEHVPDPLATMREIYRILRPGGHMVLETPRYDTAMFKLMGKRERSVRQDGHIYFFTDETLQKAYEKAGFSKTKHSHVGRSLSLRRLLWNAANIVKSDSLTTNVMRIADRAHLDRIKFSVNLRDMIRIVVEK